MLLYGEASVSLHGHQAWDHRDLLCSAPRPLTFGVDPIRVSVGQCRAVAQLLNSLRRFVVDLEDAARPSPTGRVCFRHFVHTPPTRRIGPRVVGDGPLQEDWGRQLAGVVGNCGKFAESSGRRRRTNNSDTAT